MPLEYEDHRALYEWVLEAAQTENRPRQIDLRAEFTHTVMSKPKLRELVEQGYVAAGDDRDAHVVQVEKTRLYAGRPIRYFCTDRRSQEQQHGQLRFWNIASVST